MMARPLLYAHRLGRGAGPDSSAAALAVTLDGPADGLETDVCMTADGELVLLHDPWLATGTTAIGWAHEVPWNPVLRDARLRDRAGEPTQERILRVDDLLDVVPPSLLLQSATALDATRSRPRSSDRRAIQDDNPEAAPRAPDDPTDTFAPSRPRQGARSDGGTDVTWGVCVCDPHERALVTCPADPLDRRCAATAAHPR